MLSYCFNFENSILIIKRILTFLSERSSEIAFYTNFLCGRCFFFQYRFIQVCILYLFLWKTIFSSFYVFYMFCVWNAPFMDFLWHSYYLHTRVRRSVICSDFKKFTCKNKCLIKLITKSMPLKRFWILEISFIRENVEHSQNERVKWFIRKKWKKWIIKKNY